MDGVREGGYGLLRSVWEGFTDGDLGVLSSGTCCGSTEIRAPD